MWSQLRQFVRLPSEPPCLLSRRRRGRGRKSRMCRVVSAARGFRRSRGAGLAGQALRAIVSCKPASMANATRGRKPLRLRTGKCIEQSFAARERVGDNNTTQTRWHLPALCPVCLSTTIATVATGQIHGSARTTLGPPEGHAKLCVAPTAAGPQYCACDQTRRGRRCRVAAPRHATTTSHATRRRPRRAVGAKHALRLAFASVRRGLYGSTE